MAHECRDRHPSGNAVTVLNTHDGIGVIGAGPPGDRAGLLSHDEMAAVFRPVHDATGGHSSAASAIPPWMTLPHQINATWRGRLDIAPGCGDLAWSGTAPSQVPRRLLPRRLAAG